MSAMNLEDLQRTMAAAVMMPLTSDEQMQTRTSDGRLTSELAADFIKPNTRLTAFERLEIYNRQYWFRVLGALAEDFPALRSVLGRGGFHEVSVAYLRAHPSRSFTLRNLGILLPEWLLANPQFAGRRHALAVDIARIEWAFVEAFDSAENAPLSLEAIATLDGNSTIALQPHVQLLALTYPADKLVVGLHQREKQQLGEAGATSHQSDEGPVRLPRIRRRPTWVAAHRVDHSVYYRRLAREEFLALAALRDGQPLGPALDFAFENSSMPEERRAQAVQKWFASWAELGWLCQAQSPEQTER